jgi:hypothetical protein
MKKIGVAEHVLHQPEDSVKNPAKRNSNELFFLSNE